MLSDDYNEEWTAREGFDTWKRLAGLERWLVCRNIIPEQVRRAAAAHDMEVHALFGCVRLCALEEGLTLSE